MTNYFNKLKINYELSQKNSIDISIQEDINNDISRQIKNKSIIYFSKTINDFSSDWNNMTYDEFGTLAYTNWDFIFEEFDIRLLPFINIQPIYQIMTGNTEKLMFPYIERTYLIEDIVENNTISDYYKKVYLKVSCTFSNLYYYDVTLQVKLQMSFINPRNY